MATRAEQDALDLAFADALALVVQQPHNDAARRTLVRCVTAYYKQGRADGYEQRQRELSAWSDGVRAAWDRIGNER